MLCGWANTSASGPTHFFPEGSDPGIAPLWLACRNGNAALVEILLAGGADPNGRQVGGQTVLMTAARAGNPDAVKALLRSGADVDATESRGQTAIMWAAAEGHVDVVE
jgi:ankyrin repeat protein